jgi:hypothetical protein
MLSYVLCLIYPQGLAPRPLSMPHYFFYCQCITHLKITREDVITNPSRFNSFYVFFFNLSSISHLIACTNLLNYPFSKISTLCYPIKVESLNYPFSNDLSHNLSTSIYWFKELKDKNFSGANLVAGGKSL